MSASPAKPLSLSRRILQGELASQFWNAAAKGLGLINSFLVLAALSVYDFGLYQLILAAMAIAHTLSTGLFDEIVFTDTARGLAEGRARESKRLFGEFLAFKVIVGLALTVAIFLGAERIAAHYGALISGLLKIASLLIIVEALREAQGLFFDATVSLAGFAVPAVGELAKLPVLLAFLAVSSLGIREVLVASVIGASAALIYSTLAFARGYRRTFGHVRAGPAPLLLPTFRRYGWLVAVRYAVSRVSKNIRPWLIKAFVGTEAVAFYALAINLITLAQSLIPTAMIGRVLPWQAADPKRLRYVFGRSIKYVFWLGAALAVILAVLAPPLINLIFPKYAPATPLFLAFLPILVLYGVYKLLKSLLVALREQRVLTARLVTEMILVSGLNVLLLPLIGLWGVAVEYALTYAWRVGLFWQALGRNHPELRVRAFSLLSVDGDDRAIAAAIGREVARPFRRAMAWRSN